MRKITQTYYSKIILFLSLTMLIWWGFIAVTGLQNTNQNYFYGACEGILPIIASIFGFLNAKKWGLLESSMGKAVIFISTGLLTWGVGTIIFAYYNIFLNVAVPYPSVADAFYIISWPLWATGMICFSQATGAGFQLKKKTGRFIFFLVPLIVIAFSYYFLIIVARGGGASIGGPGGALKLFFDLAYPIGDVVILTLALIIYGLSFNYLGGLFKWPIVIILLGFSLNYFADFSFSYTTTKGTYFVGDWVDLLFTVVFILLSFGITLIDPILLSDKN